MPHSRVNGQFFDHCRTSNGKYSTSTAIGAAYASKKRTTLVTGDLSFFYDSNALWNNYIPKDFRIVLINNSGGGIFKIIPGPSSTDSLDFFETPHNLTAEHLCKMFGLEYSSAKNLSETKEKLSTLTCESANKNTEYQPFLIYFPD